MYSQGKEEEIIVGLLDAEKRLGHFLDVGAYDGVTFSNTLRLVELGWSGVCVEPSPTVFPALLKRHRDNPKITLVNAAVTTAKGFTAFWDSGGDAISTTSEAHRDKWAAGWKVTYSQFFVYGITFANIFEQFGTVFDFVNLDVEGVSADMFMRMPLQLLTQCKVLCVEHDSRMADIQEYAGKFGFNYVYHNGENLILSR